MEVKFNEYQLKALNSKNDVLISAGAGSGKTAVLTEKVFNIINKKEYEINNLLVLTFTDNAAYQMKSKIIEKFNQKNSPLAEEISSAHIQTFDSFSSFLVRKYGVQLGINPNFNIISSSIIEAKTRQFLEEYLNEVYAFDDADPRKIELASLIKQFAYRSEDSLISIILEINKKLKTLPKKEEELFLEMFLDNDLFLRFKEDFYEYSFENFFFKLIESFEEFNDELAELNEDHYENIKEFIELIVKKDIELILDELFFNRSLKLRKSASVAKKLSFDASLAYNSFFNNFKAFKACISDFKDLKEQARLLNKQNIAINNIFKIIKVLDRKIEEYKRLSSSYTFSDISNLALELVNNPKYNLIKEEIINTFKFILVDEYQDTNDIQESFINALAANGKNKLFVVGDLKQSIYRFRYANPAIFASRRNEYLIKGERENKEAIDMNINYRSLKIILEQINQYFMNNMSLDNGGVDFSDKEILVYDEESDIFHDEELKKYQNNQFGFNILTNHLKFDYVKNETENEAYLILNDILKKIKEGYLVIDSTNNGIKYRKCEFKDFAILTKRKTNFDAYKTIFEDNGLPINVIFDENVREIDPIIVIESLFSLFNELKKENKLIQEIKVKHYLTSILRSYLYEYDDKTIFNLLGADHQEYLNNEVYLKMKKLSEELKDQSTAKIFNSLINEFNIIKNLNKIGDVSNALNKIEYLYKIAETFDNTGEGYEGYSELFTLFNKYRSELAGTSLISSLNAIDLTTIHKSKGLEYKIVYLPLSENKFYNQAKSLSMMVDKEYGISLKNRGMDEDVNTFYLSMSKKKEEKEGRNEFERLLYVAFTRAKESLFFVGDLTKESTILTELKNSFRYHYELSPTYKELVNKLFNDDEQIKVIINNLNKVITIFNILIDYKFNHNSLKKYQSNQLADLFLRDNENLVEDLISFGKGYIYKPSYSKGNYVGNKLVNEAANNLTWSELKNIPNFLISYQSRSDELIVLLEKFINLNKKMINFIIVSFIFNHSIFNNEYNESSYKNYYYTLENNKQNYIKEEFINDDLFIKFINEFYKLNQDITPLTYFKFIDFKTNYIPSSSKEEGLINIKEEVKLESSELHYDFKEKINKKASHSLLKSDQEINNEKLEFGTKLHALLEIYDFKKRDLSFIKDEKEKTIIAKVIDLPILKSLKDDKEVLIRKEYSYLDDNQKGIIDLLLIYKDKIYIIDYKTKKIDDEAYKRQLNIYKNNILKLFPKYQKENVKMFLLSLIDAKIEEVADIF